MTGSSWVVAPAAGPAEGPGGRGMTEEEVDRLAARAQALADRRREARREWDAVLGMRVLATTVLPMPGGGSIGPARDRRGRVLSWTLWCPQRLLLVDVRRGPVAPEEVEDRAAFAAEHGLRYAVVEPGERLSLPRLREFLEGGPR